ncbi:conserved Plasmodium protein, unknown function [Plasmodium knowlesi strain H]|uniref:EamA domain-containing protein n=3 Tax=Plasmodium knowlesi TaxID=5850 RepID=A0A5K1UKU6_PLAKH|nr:conserved Plasmodium protein, unknown function [Plasmodium knowlesi strain H]OTN65138.1 Uncharacterized protein PKNOH_S120155200 [Plasmodium knowlesi]CAA9988408.1 conserved Plasmodium protein, unknown function [Plasmodium knowlesi strain H]SBO19906.1 conserved Plasmodium protein, unknown function [Plasmodium knowlesi strain H]SBO20383.1 conserved Plasmodium protein, unknown function [Plasmodium knowlesi strain H]VVS77882.1 conserved Plasmodium protein, unknown function [Plasmodium knowlesi |eukprot:XP_002259389.1 hypothetical protein, conserved in Plasmodium species [Plasmodium knowlesi strain H]
MSTRHLISKVCSCHIFKSLISSLSGTLASVFFKKASDVSIFRTNLDGVNISWSAEIGVRIIYLLLFLIFNVLMLKYYLLLMKHYSAFLATILNFVFNFFLSAIMGILFFSEKRDSYWILGGLFIIVGLVLIMADVENEEKKKI